MQPGNVRTAEKLSFRKRVITYTSTAASVVVEIEKKNALTLSRPYDEDRSPVALSGLGNTY